MMLQLDPPLPMTTPKGAGLAHFVIDYGAEAHLMWVVFLDADGACWTVPNPEVRLAPNWSLGRRLPQPGRPRPEDAAPASPPARPAAVPVTQAPAAAPVARAPDEPASAAATALANGVPFR